MKTVFSSRYSAREAKESSNVKKEMDVHDLWEYETGYRLTGSIAYELEELESTHGRESFHAALKQAVASNNRGRVTFNYFKAILEKKKGGERVGKSDSSAPNGGITYDLTGTDVIPDWAKDLV